jgi:hypothetical protein
MNSSNFVRQGVAVALVSLLAGCASWNAMDHEEKATAEGATGGAIVGAAVGGPIGAAVGAGVGGVVANKNAEHVPTFTAPTANQQAQYNPAPASRASSNALPANEANEGSTTANAATSRSNNTNSMVNDNNAGNDNATASTGNGSMQNDDQVREAQRALNDRGYSAGTVDGIMGPHTEQALRQFQQAQGLGVTGTLDAQTMSALGVSQP